MRTMIIDILKIFGITFFKFHPVPRLWCVWLVFINLACLYFIAHLEAQVVLGTTLLAVIVQAVIYGQIGFTRVLGAAHLAWIPMFVWLFWRIQSGAADTSIHTWIWVLSATNAISFIIDSVEALRFINGDREPNYRWS